MRAADVVLTPNPSSWSAAASVLYVDSPAGTGMSFTPGQRGPYSTNDTATIDDLEALLAGIMARYPHLAGLRLFIAGEARRQVLEAAACSRAVAGCRCRRTRARSYSSGACRRACCR